MSAPRVLLAGAAALMVATFLATVLTWHEIMTMWDFWLVLIVPWPAAVLALMATYLPRRDATLAAGICALAMMAAATDSFIMAQRAFVAAQRLEGQQQLGGHLYMEGLWVIVSGTVQVAAMTLLLVAFAKLQRDRLS